MAVCADVGVIARKEGSMRVFKDGQSMHVTVLVVDPQAVSGIMTDERNGYKAIQVASGHRKAKNVTKPVRGHLAKARLETARVMKEFRLPDHYDLAGYTLGDEVPLARMSSVKHVNVQARTIGKGYAGPVKRHNFGMQDATHGNSKAHRAHGSTGQCQDPGRVFKNKKMSGQMGHVVRTVKNLEVIAVNEQDRYMLVKGAVPGAKGGTVYVYPTQFIEATAASEES